MDRTASRRARPPNSARPIASSGNRPPATGRPAAKVLSIRSSAREQGSRRLPAGDAILVVHSGTIRAVLAIALDLAPDNALRFVIDPLSLTRIDRLEDGWRVVAVNQRWRSVPPWPQMVARCAPAHPTSLQPFASPRSVGRPMPAASKPPSTARICPVM